MLLPSRRQPRAPIVALLLLAPLLPGCAELSTPRLEGVLGSLLEGSGGAPLSEQTVAAGLREALEIGSRNATAQTSTLDGFLANELIRIHTPPELERMSRGLRAVGLGAQVDAFETQMNRAAEGAAAEATAVFVDAVQQLTIQDALGILRGPDDAATVYLRRTTGSSLEQRFAPIVDAKMREVGLVRIYDRLLAQWRQIPLAPAPDFDLRSYVTDGAMNGIFTVVAQEERKIRTDPRARVTDLLRTVFR